MLRTRQLLGKYRIERRLAEGGFAVVYRALDTIEGVRVALKVPHAGLITEETLDEFRSEVRLTAKLDHPNILPLKNASFIDGHFVIATPLGERTLGDRLTSRMSLRTALDFAEQILEALEYAHHHRIIHCDVKPENFILFAGGRLRLTDFGISKVAMRTIRASGSGTVGYIAPEQAMGKPSFRSDVFSAGLVLFRMFTGRLPEWPYDWPPLGLALARRRLPPELIEFLRRALMIDPKCRYRDARQMLAMFRRVRPKVLREAPGNGRQSKRATTKKKKKGTTRRDWREVRQRQFLQVFGKALETRFGCSRCGGPVSEAMQCCPWCGKNRKIHTEPTRFPAQCPRCLRGMKLDWKYCAWCYGPGFEVQTRRQYTDVRYKGRCAHPSCQRKVLMPFMRYCPWCHRKVKRKWKIPHGGESCSSCGWGVLRKFWDYCPWCGKSAAKR